MNKRRSSDRYDFAVSLNVHSVSHVTDVKVNYTNVAIKAGDVLMWQMLASVIIPGTICKICS